MADDGTSYKITIDEEIGGLESAIGKIEEAEQAIPKVTAELGKLEGGMKHASEASEKAGHGHAKHGKDAEHLQGILGRLVHQGLEPFLERAKQVAEFEFIRKGVDALIEAPGEIVEKLKELGEEMILTAAKAERLDQSFKLTLGQEGAEEVLGWIERISSKTEFTDEQLKGWSSELLRAGVKMGDVDKFLAAGLDTAAKSTNKLEGMSAAISALTRAQLTGKVETRALRGLSIGIDELKELPQFKGMNDKQIQKKMTEGSISKDDLLSLIAGKGGVLGDLGIVAGKTFEAQLKNVKEIPEQIFEGLYKTAGFQKLGDFLGNIYETFGPETETGRHAAEALASGLEYVSAKLETIDLDVVAAKVSSALDELPVVIETVGDLFEKTGNAIGFFADAIEGVIKILHDFTPAGFVYDHFIKKSKAEENTEFRKGRDPVEMRFEAEQREKLTTAREKRARGEIYVDPELAMHPDEDPLERAKRRKSEIRKELHESGKASGEGLKSGAQESNPKLAAAGASMGEALKQGTNDSLEIHSPSRALFRSGAFAGDGFVDGIESRRADIESAMDTAFSVPATAGPAAGAAAALGIAGASITIDMGGITVTAPEGSDPNAFAAAIERALKPMLPGALLGALDGIRTEAGS